MGDGKKSNLNKMNVCTPCKSTVIDVDWKPHSLPGTALRAADEACREGGAFPNCVGLPSKGTGQSQCDSGIKSTRGVGILSAMGFLIHQLGQ